MNMKKTLLSTLALGLTFISQAQIPTDSLKGYWPMSGNGMDESGYGNHMNVNGDTHLTNDRFGNANRAYRLDGFDDFMATNAHIPTGDSAKSVSLWFKADSLHRGWILSGGNNAAGEAFGVFIDNHVTPDLIFHGHNSFFDVNMGTASIMDTTSWFHVVLSYNGTELQTYINGVAGATKTMTLGTGMNVIIIGSRQDFANQTTESFEGIVDDIRLYNRSLTAAEALALYNEPNPVLSVEEVQLDQSQVKLYPNPASTILNIQSKYPVTSVQVLSMSGQLLHQSDDSKINLESFNDGLYLIKISTEKGIVTKRFIKG